MRYPKGFLKINNLEIKELAYRVVNSQEHCLRCNVLSNVSTIGANLYNFICDVCRLDDINVGIMDTPFEELHDGFDFRGRFPKIPHTVNDMNLQMPGPIDPLYDPEDSK